MKQHTNKLALVGTLFGAISFAQLSPITSRSCIAQGGGGGGGTPLVDISPLFPKGHTKIPVLGSVLEFFYWEANKELVYRNSKKEIYTRPLKGSDKWQGELYSSMSRLTDAEEQYILEEQDTRFLDISQSKWHSFSTKYPLSHHLFWAKENSVDVLYSLSDVYSCGGDKPVDRSHCSQTLVIYRYGPGSKVPSSCNLHSLPGETFSIGRGQSYPNLFIYKSNPDPKGGTNVFLYSVDVRKATGTSGVVPNCQLTPLFPPTIGSSVWIPGKPEAVYMLPAQNGIVQKYASFVVKTDDTTDNVLWFHRKSSFDPLKCQAFNFNGREPMVLPSSKSLLATWTKDEGTTIVFPEKKESARLFKSMYADKVQEDDFWLADNGSLFVTAPEGPGKDRQIYFTDISR